MKARVKQCRKQLVENCPISLDIDRLILLRILIPGLPSTSTIYWTESNKKILSVAIKADLMHPALSWLTLRFSVTDAAGKPREVKQTIAIARTYPGFGRVRHWFVDEGRRVGRLYLPGGSDQFRSRHVHKLAYASQGLTRTERTRRREVKLRQRLGVESNSEGIPPKPARMRWRTYDRLVRGLFSSEERQFLHNDRANGSEEFAPSGEFFRLNNMKQEHSTTAENELEGFPADLNRRDSQGVSNGRFFVH